MLTALDILAARRRIRDRIRRTPLVRSEWLSSTLHADVHLKLESLQTTGSFKLRGALNAAQALLERHRGPEPPRLVTASAGNHGRALAYAAEQLRVPLTVYAPATAPHAKLDAIRRHRAELRETADYDEAERQAKLAAGRGDGVFVSPYNDRDVIAGAGTVAIEIFEDCPDVDLIVVPVGGGGLVSGVASAARAIAPAVDVAGIEVEASHVFHDSLAAGRLVEIEVGPTLADGLAGNADPDTITFAYIQRLVSQMAVVNEEALRRAMRDLAGREHLIAEGAGAVGVAALAAHQLDAEGRRVVAIVSGANIDIERFRDVLSA